MSEIRIGCSGWNYKDWRGPFYPQGMATKNWFAFYAQSFDTVEINNSFYRLPSPDVFGKWRAQAPDGFCYCGRYPDARLQDWADWMTDQAKSGRTMWAYFQQ